MATTEQPPTPTVTGPTQGSSLYPGKPGETCGAWNPALAPWAGPCQLAPGHSGFHSSPWTQVTPPPDVAAALDSPAGNLCGACGDYVPGGADPDVMASHVCEPESCP